MLQGGQKLWLCDFDGPCFAADVVQNSNIFLPLIAQRTRYLPSVLMVAALGAPYAMRDSEAMCYYAMRKGVGRCSTLSALCKVILMHGIGTVMTAGSWRGNGQEKELSRSASGPTNRMAAGLERHRPSGGA